MAVINLCTCCKKEREEKGLAPRKLEELPGKLTEDKDLFSKVHPLLMCLVCDGDAYSRALQVSKDL